jgi:hypothetical protein
VLEAEMRLSQTPLLSRHARPDRRPGSTLYLDARKTLASNRRLHRLMRETIAEARESLSASIRRSTRRSFIQS